jgi:asparagine synthase (glutamine-hydrolysing)
MDARALAEAGKPAAAISGLAAALERATLRLAEPPGPLVVLYSGGVDSSVLAWILRARPETVLHTIGRPDSPDLLAAAEGSKEIGLTWSERRLGAEEIRAAERRWGELLGRVPEPEHSVQLALALAFETAPSERVLLGQGADELFWGYARIRSAPIAEAERLAQTALVKLLATDLPLSERLAVQTGHTLLLPYLDPEVRARLSGFPPQSHYSDQESKPLLRKVARELGVPLPARERPKSAIQYGSRIAQALQRERGRP